MKAFLLQPKTHLFLTQKTHTTHTLHAQKSSKNLRRVHKSSDHL